MRGEEGKVRRREFGFRQARCVFSRRTQLHEEGH